MAKRRRVSFPDIAAVFRDLAGEHARRREALDRPGVWRLIRIKQLAPEAGWKSNAASWTLRVLVPAAVAAGVAFAVLAGSSTELAYRFEGATLSDGFIRSESQNAVLDFSDGSRVEMEKGSAARVDVTGAHSARTRLASGVLEVSVHHEIDTDYRFLAGPYEVRVIGTKFRLAWRPQSNLFSIAMHEGRVRVLGPDHFERELTRGQSLELGPTTTTVAAAEPPAPAAEPNPQSARPAASPVARAALDRRAATSAETMPPESIARNEGASWIALVAKGRFGEVVDAAQGEGVERALRERPAAELNALAHAAHYTGRSSLAVSAWSSLRERFAGQKSARQAAFFMGRLFDQQGRTADAARWLNVYLSEAPGDVYASEALGRKLGVVRKLEGLPAAQQLARDYLQRFPKGAYAQSARDLLDR